jgi:hypothetical protein
MTTENTTDAAELDRLREHNKQLLAELTAHKAAQEALQAAQGTESTWRTRWHETAVLAPLEADLRGAASGPWKYLKDTCAELGLLKMELDGEGIERPVWYDEKGQPADLKQGLHQFLCSVHQRTGNDLGHCLRSTGTSGSGATGAGFTRTAPTTDTPVPVPRPALGLR